MTEGEMSSKVSSQVREEYGFESRRRGLWRGRAPRWKSMGKPLEAGIRRVLEQPREAEPRSPSLLHQGLLGRDRPSRDAEGLLPQAGSDLPWTAKAICSEELCGAAVTG